MSSVLERVGVVGADLVVCGVRFVWLSHCVHWAAMCAVVYTIKWRGV